MLGALGGRQIAEGAEVERRNAEGKAEQSHTRRTQRNTEEKKRKVVRVLGCARVREMWVNCVRAEARGSEGEWCWVPSAGCRGRKKQSRTRRTRRDAEEERKRV